MSAFGATLSTASATFTMDDRPFQQGGQRVIKTMETMGRRLEKVATAARRMLLVGGAAIGGFIKVASDAAETASKFEAVFRDGADAANEWGAALGKSVGRSKTDIQEALSTFQGFFVGLGFGSDKARQLSQDLTALSIDFASFNNLSDEEAAGRFISALSGSSEVLDRFGINIKQAALDAKLLEQGMKGGARGASEQQKALARLAIIMEAMTDQGAVGDAIRTSDQFANRMRRLKGEIKDASIEIGNIFIPAVTESVRKVQELVPKIAEWVQRNQDAVVANTALAAKIGLVLIALPKLIAFLRVLIPLLSQGKLAAVSFGFALQAMVPLILLSRLSKINTEIARMKRLMVESTREFEKFAEALKKFNEAQTPSEKLAGLKGMAGVLEAKIKKRQERLLGERAVSEKNIMPITVGSRTEATRIRKERAAVVEQSEFAIESMQRLLKDTREQIITTEIAAAAQIETEKELAEVRQRLGKEMLDAFFSDVDRARDEARKAELQQQLAEGRKAAATKDAAISLMDDILEAFQEDFDKARDEEIKGMLEAAREAKAEEDAEAAKKAGAAKQERGLGAGQFLNPQALFRQIQQKASGIDRALREAQKTSANTKNTANNTSKTVAVLQSVDALLRGGFGAVFT